jgi:hypothetical protein
MGKIRFPALLAAVYDAAVARAAEAPTTLIQTSTTLFHYFDQQYFMVDTQRRILRRDHAMQTLVVRNVGSDDYRFTGVSHSPLIASQGGLYCALQQQALVNEAAHYVESGRAARAAAVGASAPAPLPRSAVMYSKAAVKIETMGPVLAADFSAHNPFGKRYVDSIGADGNVKAAMTAAGKSAISLWDAMNEGDDCSVARGLGLAMAKHGYEALLVQTARASERSDLERGDNIVFFGLNGRGIRNLWIVEAYLFPVVGPLQVYPVEY